MTFGQKGLDFGKIKILHPQKHSLSYGYDELKAGCTAFRCRL